MTPKEKAKLLIYTFLEPCGGTLMLEFSDQRIAVESAKLVSLVMIDELQQTMEKIMPNPPFQQYWFDTKLEISKF